MRKRFLDVAPGAFPVKGFEGIDILPKSPMVRKGDVRKLPYKTGTFSVVYASHIIEHIAWYETAGTLREWARVLRKGGVLEVWTVNFRLVASLLLAHEDGGPHPLEIDPKWKRFNPDGDPYLWAAGRVFAHSRSFAGKVYGEPCWHRALFTPKSLTFAMRRTGLLTDVREMTRAECRGYWHGVVNLGVCGIRI